MQRMTRAGTPMTYSEILRVMGRYADRNNLEELRIIETDEGIVIQGRVTAGDRLGEIDTYQLSIEDLSELRQDALLQRGVKL
ncbi:MAG: hypothetical protein WCF84_24025 [Anaerolineae bacterium]